METIIQILVGAMIYTIGVVIAKSIGTEQALFISGWFAGIVYGLIFFIK